MFLGQLLHKIHKKTYVKLFVGVESGYNTDTYVLRVRNLLVIKNILVGDQVLFAGQYISKKNIRQFQFHFIMKYGFSQCSECLIPLSSNVCFIKHDKEAQKLEGEWKVVHKVKRDRNIKVFFEKGHYVFAAVTTPKHWYYRIFRNLKDTDKVLIEGWRYRQKTSIKSIVSLKYVNDESHYEVIDDLYDDQESHYEVMDSTYETPNKSNQVVKI